MFVNGPFAMFLLAQGVLPVEPAPIAPSPAPNVVAVRPSGPLASGPGLMPVGVAAEAPLGYARMCEKDTAACLVTPGAPVAATPDERALLRLAKRINRRVNNAVEYRPDGADDWARPSGEGRSGWLRGDCEDYAIEKRARLIAAGFPADRLFYAVGYQRRVGLHAVLVARIGGRDLVLDNRTPWVRGYRDTSYTWLLHQSFEDPKSWRAV